MPVPLNKCLRQMLIFPWQWGGGGGGAGVIHDIIHVMDHIMSLYVTNEFARNF